MPLTHQESTIITSLNNPGQDNDLAFAQAMLIRWGGILPSKQLVALNRRKQALATTLTTTTSQLVTDMSDRLLAVHSIHLNKTSHTVH
jgi:hypothetical protein